jgi:hypothetical protein
MSGHVATTIVVDQMIESMKGHKIQKLAAMSVPRKNTESVERARSREDGISVMSGDPFLGRETVSLLASPFRSFASIHFISSKITEDIWQ